MFQYYTEVSFVNLSIYDLRIRRVFLSTGFFCSHLSLKEGTELFDGEYNPAQTGKPLLMGLLKIVSENEVAL